MSDEFHISYENLHHIEILSNFLQICDEIVNMVRHNSTSLIVWDYGHDKSELIFQIIDRINQIGLFISRKTV